MQRSALRLRRACGAAHRLRCARLTRGTASRHRRLLRDVVRRFRVKLEQPDPHVQLLALQARAAPRTRSAKAAR